MTLADTILNRPGPLARLLLADPGGRAFGANVPVVVADNVAESFFADSPIEDWDVRRDFPDLTPRLLHCFVEMGRPSRLYSASEGVNPSAHLPKRWGWRVDVAGRDDLAHHLARGGDAGCRYRDAHDRLAASGLVDVEAVERALDAADPYATARGLGGHGAACLTAAGIARELDLLRGPETADREGGRLGWLLHAGLVVYDGTRVSDIIATADIPLDRDGRVLLPPLFDLRDGQVELRTGGDPGRAVGDYRKLVTSLLLPALLTLSYFNCAGVHLHPCEFDHGPLKAYTLDIGAVTRPTRN